MFLRGLVLFYFVCCFLVMRTMRGFVVFVAPPAIWVYVSTRLELRPSWQSEFRWLSWLGYSLWSAFALYWYVYMGIMSSPEPWGFFDTSVSPVGKSACCSSVDAPLQGRFPCCTVVGEDALSARCVSRIPWHPAGHVRRFEDAPTATNSSSVTFCPMGSWADDTGVSPTSYNRDPATGGLGAKCLTDEDCDGLATNRLEDWPNLARGLRKGWDGSGAENKATPLQACPGVALVRNDQNIMGKGQEICSKCAFPRPRHCAPERYQWMCFMCPGGYLSGEPIPPSSDIRLTAEMLFVGWLFVMISTCASIMPNTQYPRHYNPVF